ncbi:DEAD/DEAH box helicase [Selenomonas ruminantium]|uniref:AAA domain-containing protein n=1 Tax=Selenomonas ruminantium TaxID=971 RepID=A0A1K1NLJ3_SELRU|nr:AAA domain-containing protein [Selenomonas ruminantium]SFW36167.1 AAA domain-containing protein [Selenomonas ruminantium]
MDFRQMHFEVEFELWLQLAETKTVTRGAVELLADPQQYGRFRLRQGDVLVTAEAMQQSASMVSELYGRLQRGGAHYEQIMELPAAGRCVLRMACFERPEEVMTDFSVVVPDILYKGTSIKKNKWQSWPEYLQDELRLPGAADGEAHFFFTPGKDGELTIWGPHIYLKVELHEDKGSQYLSAIELKSHNHSFPPVVRLGRGSLCILDERQSNAFQADRSAIQYERLVAQAEDGSYISNWDAYGELEGDILLDKARKVGALHFTKAEPAADGGNETRFFLQEEPPHILTTLSKGRDSFCLVPEQSLPPYLLEDGRQMSWELYREIMFVLGRSKPDKEDPFAAKPARKGSMSFISWREQHPNWSPPTKVIRGKKFVRFEPKSRALVLEKHENYPSNMVLVYDILGSQVSLDRKEKARTRIRDGREAGMPHLRFLLEGNMAGGQTLPKVPHIDAITPFVQKKIFTPHPPTQAQAAAVDIALNTPDIALIQGPPGTGKTTVISAIVERLNELADEKENSRGQVLVTAFQHDAVNNVISKLSVNALPTYKFGKKDNEEEEGRDINEMMDVWVEALRGRLHQKYPELGLSQDTLKLERLYGAYIRQPRRAQCENLLAGLAVVADTLPANMQRELYQLRQEYALGEDWEPGSASQRERVGIVRSLRVVGGISVDDDQRRAMEFYTAFEQELTEEENIFLRRFMSKEPSEEDYQELKRLKQKYLSLCVGRPHYHKPKVDKHLDAFCQRTLLELRKQRRTLTRKQEILAEYAMDLADDPVGVRESMIDMEYVFSATVQQSEGRDIRRVKGKDDSFETVIVDEAARSSPLDLLIPMAGARRRIILVGDHKQLPHIVDDEVCKRMEEDGNQEELDAVRKRYEKSLFQHLFERMQELEQHDHVRRTITLDKQFRMHPLIGEFVSRHFYGGQLESPLPAELFVQQLPGMEGRPVCWLDVPYSKETEEKQEGTSRVRVVEAQAAVRLLRLWMDSEAGRNMTFGVISFYKAQNGELYRALEEAGMAVKHGNVWRIEEPYRTLREGSQIRERLRIGTVDAFQGMEFDVVLLMMVRTRKMPIHLSDNERDYNKVFGHLRSKNRLCVSMSRAKKVLAVIGDKALAQSSEARNRGNGQGPELGIPELADFADLCGEQGIVMEWGKELL